MNNASRSVGSNAVSNGVALSRSLEFSAREKGVEFMLHRRFDELIPPRGAICTGRVLGINAHYSPRQHPETGEVLQSFWQNGNIDERRETVSIRARRSRHSRKRRPRRQSRGPQHVLPRPCGNPRSRRAASPYRAPMVRTPAPSSPE